MMYSEFIEKTKLGESYITYSMYTEKIEPVYMNAPNNIDKDTFCKRFYKLHTKYVSDMVSALITATPATLKEQYINGYGGFEEIEADHQTLLQIFLKALPGLMK